MTNSYVNDFNTTVKTYYDELKRCKPISRDKERELIIKAKAGDNKARQQVLSANLKFVFSVAARYKGKGADLPDLISEGNLGLIKAIDKFDVDKDVKFISYAVWWIRNSIQEFIKKRQTILSVETDDEELKTIVGGRGSLFDDYEDDESVTVCEVMVGDTVESDEETVEQNQKKLVDDILSKLDDRERKIIECYYGIGGKKEMNLEEIGSLMGITKERVRQIKEQGFRKLRTEVMMVDIEETLFL